MVGRPSTGARGQRETRCLSVHGRDREAVRFSELIGRLPLVAPEGDASFSFVASTFASVFLGVLCRPDFSFSRTVGQDTLNGFANCTGPSMRSSTSLMARMSCASALL